MINQRKAFYPEFKSMTIDIVGINQWNKRYTSRKQLAQLILDCSVIPELKESVNFLKLQRISSNLCHRLHLARLNKLAHSLATDASLTADPGVARSIPPRSHTFVEIDHEIISTVILLPSAESFEKGCCQLQAKVCARSTG